MSVELSAPGQVPKMKWIGLDDLIVDHTYQREVDSKHVQRILEKFNWRFFQAITVTPIEGGKYAVIDGQHRTVAARTHPQIDQVPCVIVEARSIKEQAEGFIRMNMSHRKITPVEIYWAALAAGDEEYMAMADLFERVGVVVHTHSGYGTLPPRNTAAVNTIRNLIRRHGEGSVEKSLRGILLAWPETPNALISRIIEACEFVVRVNRISSSQIAKSLSIWEPRRLLDQARLIASEQDIKIAQGVVHLISRTTRKAA